ncbi:hypothetical protein BJ165DRAFT_166046 [Panaeolus papilionaceus]|nr:hypothetical protein BJ165DRAFT_166046 [Panaeolus papilionaceus]
MSQLQLQKIVHCLAGAASADVVDGSTTTTTILYTQDSSIISKELFDTRFITSSVVVSSEVRTNSTVGFILDDSIQIIIYIDTSSKLRVVEFDEEADEWYENPSKVIQHEVSPTGHVTACLNERSQIVIFFQSKRGQLTTFTLADPIHATDIPFGTLPGSPLCARLVGSTMYIFYISSVDRCLRYAIRKAGSSTWEERKWPKKPLTDVPNRLMVNIVQGGSLEFEAYVMTADSALLCVGSNGRWSRLGRVDEGGVYVSERAIDVIFTEVENDSLTDQRLGELLAEDPSIIDAVGGPQLITPLAAACWGGSLKTVTLLLNNSHQRANPNALSPKNRTPLYYAVAQSPPASRKAIVCALLDAGADIDACYPENFNNTPLMDAIVVTADKKLVMELVKRGASLTKINMRGETAAMLARLSGLEDITRSASQPVTKEVINVLVAISMLIIAYFNTQRVRDVLECVVRKLEELKDEDLNQNASDRVDTLDEE